MKTLSAEQTTARNTYVTELKKLENVYTDVHNNFVAALNDWNEAKTLKNMNDNEIAAMYDGFKGRSLLDRTEEERTRSKALHARNNELYKATESTNWIVKRYKNQLESIAKNAAVYAYLYVHYDFINKPVGEKTREKINAAITEAMHVFGTRCYISGMYYSNAYNEISLNSDILRTSVYSKYNSNLTDENNRITERTVEDFHLCEIDLYNPIECLANAEKAFKEREELNKQLIEKNNELNSILKGFKDEEIRLLDTLYKEK